ncbi:MAG: polysaccharide deacetylase family protein [Oscillospiraceae bacterium]|nr:polysaccharide deacetylase family protein [Oscillospiraceae bacterium]
MTEEKELNTTKRKRSKWWILLWITLGLLLTLAAAAVLIFLVNRFSLVITIQGEPDVTVEYGDDYSDAGAKAHLVGTLFLKSGYEVGLSTKNEVKTDTLGIYTVTYEAECLWFACTAERRVTVADTKQPVIELVSSPDTYTIPGEMYQEEGFSAVDNHDGDITAQVVRVEENGIVTYTVTDSSGNQTTVTREIVYFDPIPPEITLTGEPDITITAGHAFIDPGYAASDNCDGDLTDRVEITGGVDIYRAGTYQLNYRVVDNYGNEAAASRVVRVMPVAQPDVVKPEGKVIYLTFDDGPGSNTGRLLDILNRFNVKATFFVVNTGNYDMLKRIAAEGHSLAIHSATHKYDQIYASEEAYFNDLNTMKNIIMEQTGVETTLVRFPGGSSNMVSSFNPGIMTRLTQALTDNGYQYFDWNVDSNDAGGASSGEEVFQNVVNGCSGKDISIVLQHDIKEFSVDAVEKILIWGIANGYTFLPLDPSSPNCHHGVNN